MHHLRRHMQLTHEMTREEVDRATNNRRALREATETQYAAAGTGEAGRAMHDVVEAQRGSAAKTRAEKLREATDTQSAAIMAGAERRGTWRKSVEAKRVTPMLPEIRAYFDSVRAQRAAAVAGEACGVMPGEANEAQRASAMAGEERVPRKSVEATRVTPMLPEVRAYFDSVRAQRAAVAGEESSSKRFPRSGGSHYSDQ